MSLAARQNSAVQRVHTLQAFVQMRLGSWLVALNSQHPDLGKQFILQLWSGLLKLPNLARKIIPNFPGFQLTRELYYLQECLRCVFGISPRRSQTSASGDLYARSGLKFEWFSGGLWSLRP